jgi:malate dehydrogenase
MRFKVGIVGGGNVGAETAKILLDRGFTDVTLVDIVEGLAAGKALDMSQSAPIAHSSAVATGNTDFALLKGSDLVVITAGIPRKPGMSREDLLNTNLQIIRNVSLRIRELAPNAIVIVVTNPLDAMVYAAYKITGFPRERVMGMAGSLDSARFRYFIAAHLGVSPACVSAMVLGSHGDLMVPVLSFTSVAGIPATLLIPQDRMKAIADRTRGGGGEIVSLLKTGSAYYAPASAIAEMVESILLDQKKVIPVCTLLNGQFGISDVFVGVPAVLGARGVERILEPTLSDEEYEMLHKSAAHVKDLVKEVDALLAQL